MNTSPHPFAPSTSSFRPNQPEMCNTTLLHFSNNEFMPKWSHPIKTLVLSAFVDEAPWQVNPGTHLAEEKSDGQNQMSHGVFWQVFFVQWLSLDWTKDREISVFSASLWWADTNISMLVCLQTFCSIKEVYSLARSAAIWIIVEVILSAVYHAWMNDILLKTAYRPSDN